MFKSRLVKLTCEIIKIRFQIEGLEYSNETYQNIIRRMNKEEFSLSLDKIIEFIDDFLIENILDRIKKYNSSYYYTFIHNSIKSIITRKKKIRKISILNMNRNDYENLMSSIIDETSKVNLERKLFLTNLLK